MSFEDFLNQAWQDHATDAAGVWDRFPDGMKLVASLADIGSMAALVTHVSGEHLGQWQGGAALLEQLTRHATFDGDAPSGKAVYRSLAVLAMCDRQPAAAEGFATLARTDDGASPASDRIRILTAVASALAGQQRIDEATVTFSEALQLASYGPDAKDPAARALAAAGNNVAAELEQRAGRTPGETALMKRAAETGRRYWEVAGTWLDVERAEYRLAMTLLAAGEPQAALEHARDCVALCEDNQAVPYEQFFGWEAVALASFASGDPLNARLSRDKAEALIARMKAEVQPECREALGRLDRRLGI